MLTVTPAFVFLLVIGTACVFLLCVAVWVWMFVQQAKRHRLAEVKRLIADANRPNIYGKLSSRRPTIK